LVVLGSENRNHTYFQLPAHIGKVAHAKVDFKKDLTCKHKETKEVLATIINNTINLVNTS
jgi:hypothetical protein